MPASIANTLRRLNSTIVTIREMAKKHSTRKSQTTQTIQTRPFFMFPLLHEDVSNAVSDTISSAWFNKKGTDRDSTNEYSTHVMGSFKCSNNRCSSNGWGSKKVAIVIRRYPRNGYNALVFNQRCRFCNALGHLTLDKNSYVERVAYRLKRWAGVPMEQENNNLKKGPPHESKLCEGCRRGYCQRR